jgi:multiple sugar transport system substrate-binding protein
LLAACGGSPTSSTPTPTPPISPVTLSYWCLFYTAGAPTAVPIDTAVSQFHAANPKISVNVTGYAGDQASYVQLTQALQSGSGVDLFRVSSDELPLMVQQSLVAPTNDFLTSSDKSDIFSNILQDVTFGGKTYAWPMYVPPVGMYLNLDVFQEKNIPVPSDNWTYDEFVQIAQQLTYKRSDGSKVYGFTGFLDASVVNLWPIIMGDGGAPLSADNKTYTFNNSESISGLQKLVDLTSKYHVTPPDFGTQTTTEIRNGFANKTYAMYCEPSGQATAFAKANANFAIKPMPIGGRGKPFTCGGVGLIAVSATQDQNRLRAAMELADYLSGSQVASVSGYYTAPPVRKSIQISAPASDFTPMLPSTWIAPIIAQWPAIRLLIQPALQKAVLGQQSPKNAMDGIAASVNQALSTGS